MKNYYYKAKNLLNQLINDVEKLENVSVNREIFKYSKSFLTLKV